MCYLVFELQYCLHSSLLTLPSLYNTSCHDMT